MATRRSQAIWDCALESGSKVIEAGLSFGARSFSQISVFQIGASHNRMLSARRLKWNGVQSAPNFDAESRTFLIATYTSRSLWAYPPVQNWAILDLTLRIWASFHRRMAEVEKIMSM